MSQEIVCKRVIISGRVQGVGYRFFAVEEAERLGIQGWVRNMPDGRVEVEVQGLPDAVEDLLDELRNGPRLSHVTDMDVQDINCESKHVGFRIRS